MKIKNYNFIIMLVLILCGCNEVEKDKSHEIVQDIKTAESKTSDHLVFPNADAEVYDFFTNMDSLHNFINVKNGIYCLESSEGATAKLVRLKDESELLCKTEFLFLYRDFSFIPNKVFINDASADPCNEDTEGYFIYDLKQPQTILRELYKIEQIQSGTEAKDSTLSTLKEIDSALTKKIIVKFRSKHGDFIMLKLYFSRVENSLVLSLLDLTDCGV